MKRFCGGLLRLPVFIFLISGFFVNKTWAQNKLFMNPIKYTDRQLEVYGSPCSDPAQIHLFINNVPVNPAQLTTKFIVGGYWAFEMDFGLMKPGDVFKTTDDCGGVPYQQTVKDDYVYVEVPGGAATAGNGIGPDDQYPPYSKLSTAVAVGKCSPVNIDSHGLVSYYVFSPQTGGTFLLNGSPLTNGATAINPGGYEINFNGYQGTPVYSINANGSITANTAVKLESKTHYSGQVPLSLEYRHDGGVVGGDLSFGFKAMSIRQVKNNSFNIEKASLGGNFNTVTYASKPNSVFKITYDGVYYRAYLDNVLVDELRRFVEYGTSSGSLTPGSSAGLDYSTPVTWSGMQSGPQWVSVLIDGVLYTRQQFQVAQDITINPVVSNIACSGSSSGSITVNATGGVAPLQYALNSGAYVSANVFPNLAAGNYVIKVRDASGCIATRNVTVGSSVALQVSVAAKTNESCSATANGSVTIQASGGASPYLYSKDGTTYLTSNVFTGLVAGIYTFSVKDNNGCIGTVADTIKTTSKLLATIASQQHVSCFGGNNGSLTIGTAGSVVTGILMFSIDNGATFQASNVFTNLAAGSYKVLVKDNTCSISVNATITQPGDLTIAAVLKQAVSCNGLSDGMLEATAGSGTAPYLFSINGTQYGSSGIFGGLALGNYKIWVKDAAGCVKESAVVPVSQPDAVSVSILNKTDVSCFAGSNGALTATGLGGTFPYQFSKDGVNFQPSPTFSSLASGNQLITIKDANGCKATVKGDILQPTDITISAVNSITVSCFAGTNGQIKVAASGGTGILKYAINGTDFTAQTIFDGLPAGNYQVTAQDANGCKKVSAVTSVTQPTQIVPTFTKSDVKCFGAADGLVTVTATGGTNAYTYSKDGTNYQTAGLFQSLPAGNITFYVKDANNCVRTVDVTIGQPSALAASVSASQQVLCYNGKSGIIQAAASGGTAPYQYSVNGTTYQSSATFASLPIGTYKIWVKDVNGCVKETDGITLTQPTELVASIASQTAVKCFAGSDGSVQLAATGGVLPYSYARDSVNFQASPSFSGLPGAAIRFVIRDGNGCTKPVTAQVTQPAQAYTITLASQTNLSCYNANIGRIEVKNNGGTAPYQVSIDNAKFQTSEVFSNLSAGTYTVYGQDANNCKFTLTGINLSQPTDIVVSLISKKDVDCEYYQKGEALVSASGSTGNFSYALGGFDFKFNAISAVTNTTGFFDNLKAGDYTVTARDQSGCTKEFPVIIIPKNTNIRYDVSKTLPSNCNSQDGTISIINTSGGKQPYQYSISSQNSFGSNATFGGLLNGTYIVTVADELCSYKKEVDLTVPGSIKATYTIDPISCTTPVANLNVNSISGGNGGYQLSLNGAAPSASRSYTNLHPNVYNLLIQDNPLSCKTVLGIEIKEQNRADLQIVSKQDVLCYGGNSGMINIKGDNNVGPFSYAINNGPFGSDGSFAGLSIGTYRLYAKNRMGCVDSLRVTLVQPTQLSSSFTKTDNSCNGDNTGALELFGAGGTPAYSYSIDGANYVSSGKFILLTANTYNAYVKDANGCVSAQNVPVVQPTLLTITPVYRDTIRCFGEANGMVNIVAAGGTPSYVYSMNGTDYFPDASFKNLSVGTYKFYARDVKGCLKTSELSISQPALLELGLVSQTDPLCFEGKDGSIQVAAKGGNAGYVYTLDNAVSQPASLFQGLTQSVYSITVKDRKGCSASMKTVELKWPSKIQSKYATVMPACFGESSGTITVEVSGGSPGYQALFNGQNFNAVNNLFTFANVKSQTYPIEIKDQHGCIDKLDVLLSQPTALASKVNITNNNCYGDKTGKLEVSAEGATPSYLFALNDGQYSGNGTFADLTANAYTVRIKDSKGCVLTKEVQVVQPTEVKLLAVNQDTVRCYGERNGSIRILASGGTSGYVYSQDGTQFYSDSTFKNLAAGAYKFWVKDTKACLQTTSLSITQPSVLDLSLTGKTDPLCAGEQNGRIMLAAMGGNGTYTYWKDNVTQQKNGTFEGLTQAEYTFKVVDRRGCEDTVTSVKLVWPKSLLSQVSWKGPVCDGDNNGSISMKLAGGIAPYTVSAPQNAGAAVNIGDVWDFKNLSAGKYILNARDANGCLSVSSVNVPAPEKFNTISFPVTEAVCKGQEIVLDAGNPGKFVTWYYKEQVITEAQNQQSFNAVEPGMYKVVVTNETGCSVSSEYTLENNNNALKADFLMTVQAFVGDTVRVLDISKPAPDEIIWELPAQAQTILNEITKLSFAVIEKGEYPIKMTARKGDCINTKIRTIKIFDKEDIDQTDSLLHYQEINIVQEMLVYPNPNFGKFTVSVKLAKVSDVILSISNSSTNTPVLKQEKKGEKQYTFEISLRDFMQDTYVVTIQAGKSILFKRVLMMN